MSSKRPATPPKSRDERLKSALKANLARRKAQASARARAGSGNGVESGAETGAGGTSATQAARRDPGRQGTKEDR